MPHLANIRMLPCAPAIRGRADVKWGNRQISRASSPRRALNAVLTIVAAAAITAAGLPTIAGGNPVADAASCTRFFESNIDKAATDLTYDPQARLWLPEAPQAVNDVRGVNPAGGSDVIWTLGDPDVYRTGDPRGIAGGSDGRLWIAGGTNNSLIAVDPSTGVLSTFSLSGTPTHLAAAADGNLWITLSAADAVAKVDTTGTSLATYPLSAGAAPRDIVVGTDGALWITETGLPKIARLTTAGALTEYAIGAPAWDIAASGTDLWFTERDASKIGHLSAAGLLLFEVATPTAGAGPYGITVGADGGVWFTEHQVSRVGRLDPVLHTINETIINTSTLPPTEIRSLPDGTIWFAIEGPHLEHFKPNPDGTVGPLPPSVALTAGTPVQPGPVYSTATTFTIAGTVPGQCLDSISYRAYLASTTPGAFTTVTGTSATFSLPSSGTWVVEFYGTGPGGQSLTQTVTLVVDQSLFAGDTTPPVITTPGNLTTAATSTAGAVVTYVVTAADAKDGDVTSAVTCTPPSGSTFAIGTTTVTCTARDLTGNIATSTFTVTVTAGPPTVTVPADLVVVSAGAMTPVTFSASAASPWGGAMSVTCTPPGTTQSSPGAFTASFPHDTATTVTCVSATDGLGQQGTASFTVYPVTPPALTLPANITVTATGPTTPVSFTATATDGNGGSLPVTCAPTGAFSVGTTPVTCTATDHGVTTSGTFTVTVIAPPPVITTPGDLSFAPYTSKVVTYTVTASSVVDGSLPVTCVPPSGTTFTLGTTTVVCTTTDRRGVTVTQSFTVTIANATPTQFVIWGGNAGGVVPGQRVIFWGEHWWDQVNLPESSKIKDFKGWAETVTGTTWTTKGGNSKPPKTIPAYISVIVTMSVERAGKDGIHGTVTRHAILRVDSPYKDDPSKPVYGVVIAVIP